MQVPVDITFRGMTRNPALEAAISRRMNRLHSAHGRLQDGHVWISVPHRHRRRGATFDVKLALAVPGGDLIVVQEQDHADVRAALGAVFSAARRELDDRARIRRGEIKRHAA
jgi:ribosome-associated translation inhibitor RaiA